jgi:carboxyl-terminal processing protease
MKTRALFVLGLCTLALSSTQSYSQFQPNINSPATALYKEAAFYLEQYYFGYSSANLPGLTEQYRQELENACLPQGETCGFEVASPYIEKLLSSLRDGHSYYLSQPYYKKAFSNFAGINTNLSPSFGFTPGTENELGQVLVQEVASGTPAFEAGLQPFDRITGINGIKFQVSSAAYTLSVSVNTDNPIRFSIARGEVNKPTNLEITIKRRYTPNLNLPFSYIPAGHPGVVVMRYPNFIGFHDIGPKTHEMVKDAIAKKAKAIVVDLRGNIGGEETECSSAAAAFIAGGVEFMGQTKYLKQPWGFKNGKTTGNDPRDLRSYSITDPQLWKGKMAVLVNRNTASCGEIFAYAVQRAKRGKVIGETTLGVLNTATDYFSLIDQSAVAITYSRTVNLDGTALPERITPDVMLEFNTNKIGLTGKDEMLEKALLGMGVR